LTFGIVALIIIEFLVMVEGVKLYYGTRLGCEKLACYNGVDGRLVEKIKTSAFQKERKRGTFLPRNNSIGGYE